jgi:hypothetical protein
MCVYFSLGRRALEHAPAGILDMFGHSPGGGRGIAPRNRLHHLAVLLLHQQTPLDRLAQAELAGQVLMPKRMRVSSIASVAVKK